MTSLLCVECRIPLCVSSDTTNRIVCYDPCGHLAHERCAISKRGKAPHDIDTTIKCSENKCKKIVSNYCPIFGVKNITGDGDADQPPPLSAELRKELDEAEKKLSAAEKAGQEAEALRTQAAEQHQELSRRYTLIQNNTMPIVFRNMPLSEAIRQGRELRETIREVEEEKTKNNRRRLASGLMPHQHEEEYKRINQEERLLRKKRDDLVQKASALRGLKKQRLKEMDRLRAQEAALEALKFHTTKNNKNNDDDSDDDSESFCDAQEGSVKSEDQKENLHQQSSAKATKLSQPISSSSQTKNITNINNNSAKSSQNDNNNNNSTQNQNQMMMTIPSSRNAPKSTSFSASSPIDVDDVENWIEEELDDGIVERTKKKDQQQQSQHHAQTVQHVIEILSSSDDDDDDDMNKSTSNKYRTVKNESSSGVLTMATAGTKSFSSKNNNNNNNSSSSLPELPNTLLPHRRGRDEGNNNANAKKKTGGKKKTNNNNSDGPRIPPTTSGLPQPHRHQLELAVGL